MAEKHHDSFSGAVLSPCSRPAFSLLMFINKTKVRNHMLEYAKLNRAHKFERVGASVYVELDSIVRMEVERMVRMQPSKGKTIKV